MNFSFDVQGEHKDISRVILPFHSFNNAMSGTTPDSQGFPTRGIVDVYGDTGIGKSTAISSLASYLSQGLGDAPISYADLEGQAEDVVYNALQNSGFQGVLKWTQPKGSEKNLGLVERILNGLTDDIVSSPNHIGILDAVATVASNSEMQGDYGDANIGRRAFLMAQFTRNITLHLMHMETPVVVFLLNHHYKKGGSIGAPIEYTSPGGDVKKNLAKVRLRFTTPWVDYVSSGKGKKEPRWDKGWVITGKVEKNRSGKRDATFQLFLYGGQGIHVGMTALIDCLADKHAEVVSGGKVSMDGTDFGRLTSIIDTKFDDPEFFVPFQNRLKEQVVEEVDDEDVDDV